MTFSNNNNNNNNNKQVAFFLNTSVLYYKPTFIPYSTYVEWL